ncbi:ATP-dependent helicase [Dermabacteraceae bacterium TAE3-ERU27]|nr:ATP-dependent helicase [Dermabacteraceae bacterium TAE3-ERU27]
MPAAKRGGNPVSIRYSPAQIARLLGKPEPTPQQAEVISAPLAPMLVVAGAGSGKTETMSSRVLYLVANELVEPRQVLGLTFTRKATGELQQRITENLGLLAQALQGEGLPVPEALAGDVFSRQRPHIATYNGYALALVREHALRLGIDPDLVVLSPAAAWQLAHDVASTWPHRLGIDASLPAVTAGLLSLLGSCAEHLLDAREVAADAKKIRGYLEGIPLQDEGGRRKVTPQEVKDAIRLLSDREALLPLIEEYTRRKRELGAIDYPDQIALAARLVSEAPEAIATERQLHRVVLLDEFQDTSVAQLVFLTGLYGNGHATCAVGDPQQAIYGWRGASSASLAGFVQRAGDEVLQRQLTISWRNDAAILSAANRTAAPLRDGSAVQIPELSPSPGAGEGEIHLADCATAPEQAQRVADWISRHRDGGSAAVLVRTRAAIPGIVAALEEAGMETEVPGLGGLLYRPEVADVRAVLECVNDPARGDWLMRLLTGPLFRISPHDIAVLGRWQSQLARSAPEGESVFLMDALDDLPRPGWKDRDGRGLSEAGRERLTRLNDLLRAVRRRLNLPLPEIISYLISELGLDLELDSTRELDELRRHAAAFAATAVRPGLAAYLSLLQVSESEEAGLSLPVAEGEADPHRVTVMTMHAAKGLEWDVVAVADMCEGRLPLVKSKKQKDGSSRANAKAWLVPLKEAGVPWHLRGDAETLPQWEPYAADTQVEAQQQLNDFYGEAGAHAVNEERRLTYVALTRARKKLLLSWAKWQEGRKTPFVSSRFLEELRPLVPEANRYSAPATESSPLLDSEADSANYPPPPGEREIALRELRQKFAQADIPAQLRPTPEGESAASEGAAELEGTAGLEESAPASGPDSQRQAVRRFLADHADRRSTLSVPSPIRLSASDVVARAKDPESVALSLLRPLPRKPSPSALRGTAFHGWLEDRLEGASLLDVEELGVFADADDDSLELTRLRELFKTSAWAGYTPLAVEQPLSLRFSSATVRGVIDAVFTARDLAEVLGEDPAEQSAQAVAIIDWKTGRKPTGAAKKAREMQLSLYRLAWHEATGLPLGKIRTAFHYVVSGETVEVKRHPSRAAIEKLLMPNPAGEG